MNRIHRWLITLSFLTFEDLHIPLNKIESGLSLFLASTSSNNTNLRPLCHCIIYEKSLLCSTLIVISRLRKIRWSRQTSLTNFENVWRRAAVKYNQMSDKKNQNVWGSAKSFRVPWLVYFFCMKCDNILHPVHVSLPVWSFEALVPFGTTCASIQKAFVPFCTPLSRSY